MCKVSVSGTFSDKDLHDYIYFRYSEKIRDQQLLQNGMNGHGPTYKRAAGNKMAIWEKIRKGPIYHLVKVRVVSTILTAGFWNICK